MEKVLDPAIPDEEFVALLDKIIQTLYMSPNLDEKNAAQTVLTRLKESPNSWLKVDKVLDSPYASQQTKFYSLQILGDMINYRWKTLPTDTSESIRNYIVAKVIELSSSEDSLEREQTYLAKLNLILVQIVKQEWPTNWRSFITDIVGASKTSTSRCENNLHILSLLSEEVFEFSAGQMTQEKTKHLKNQFNEEFSTVFQLCQFVFEQFDTLKTTRPPVLVATLETLQRFLAWIPIGYILDTQLIETLLNCLAVPVLRNPSLKCLVEVAGLSEVDRDERFRFLYVAFMQQLVQVIPPNTNIAEAYESGDEEAETFIMDLALFLSTFFRNHIHVVKANGDEIAHYRQLGLEYLVQITQVNDQEVVKTCVDFWHSFMEEMHVARVTMFGAVSIFGGPLSRGKSAELKADFMESPQVFDEVFRQLRRVLISRVPKPEEVLIVEDENNEIVRETTKDTDALALYKTMKDTLVYLTHLDPEDTKNIMLDRLSMQMDESFWSRHRMNTLCWAIGSISGAMNEEEEKKFLVTVLKDLLRLTDMKKGKDNKAIVASNIMYVVGQYPRFLRAHWKFLKTLVNKLFEFMHETHPGVQDMACDTFLKIARQCRIKFVTTQQGETRPFIEEILSDVGSIVADLEPHQFHSFYESCGCIIAATPFVEAEARLVSQLFTLPNELWFLLVNEASGNENVLRQRNDMKTLVTILRTNARVAASLGPPYYAQLVRIFPDMMRLYGAYSRMLTELITQSGPHMAVSADARNIRAVKKEILRVLESFFRTSDEQMRQQVMQEIITPMTMPVLTDYYESIPDVRDAEVLSLFSQIIVYMEGLPVDTIRMIVKSVFTGTLEMIRNNFEDYPDARLQFFNLLGTVNQYNFSTLFMLDDHPAAAEAEFGQIINSIIWAFKHTERTVAETGLVILLDLLVNVNGSTYIGYFYRRYFRIILNDILSVLTDTLHRPGFKFQARILLHMLNVVMSNKVTEAMWDTNDAREVEMAGDPPSNQVFVRNHLQAVLTAAFPNLSRSQIENVLQNIYSSLTNEQMFKAHLRDFLIETKEFSGGDNTDLYDEEKQAELVEKQRLEAERRARTPGLEPVSLDEVTKAAQDAWHI